MVYFDQFAGHKGHKDKFVYSGNQKEILVSTWETDICWLGGL